MLLFGKVLYSIILLSLVSSFFLFITSYIQKSRPKLSSRFLLTFIVSLFILIMVLCTSIVYNTRNSVILVRHYLNPTYHLVDTREGYNVVEPFTYKTHLNLVNQMNISTSDIIDDDTSTLQVIYSLNRNNVEKLLNDYGYDGDISTFYTVYESELIAKTIIAYYKDNDAFLNDRRIEVGSMCDITNLLSDYGVTINSITLNK